MRRFFKGKMIFYAVMSLLLEAVLVSFLVRAISACAENFPRVNMGAEFNTRFALEYGLNILLPVLAILFIHVSMILYTRLFVKLRLKDQAITNSEAERFMRLSLIPVAQIVAMIRIMRMEVKISSPEQP